MRIVVDIDDELGKQFRIKIIKRKGARKGALKEAVEEAIRKWIEENEK